MAHLRHVLPLRNWEAVTVYAPPLRLDPALQSTVRGAAPDGLITIAQSAAECVRDAEVIMLCTSSGTPVFAEQDLSHPALITSVSTNAVRAHEIPPAMLPRMDVYCDYKRTTPAAAAEMTLAVEHFGWNLDRVAGDLADLVNGTCPSPSFERPVFFRSIGLGLEDIAIAHALYRLLADMR